MGTTDDTADMRDYGLAIFVIVLVVAAVAAVAAALMYRAPDTALVLATRHDCLRAFDDTRCRTLVGKAMTIHARTAPRFFAQRTCELDFGVGTCRELTDSMGAPMYLPAVAVILASRAGDGDEDVLPLYLGPKSERRAAAGQRVYFHGLAAGVLSEGRFGGADISMVANLEGKPMTSAMLRKIRQR
jgi:uncharacterized protein YgiB involved in biofilm formation